MQLTPEEALKHLDGVASKYQGTRDDHAVLQFSTQLLRNIVVQYRELLKQNAVLHKRILELTPAETVTEPQLPLETEAGKVLLSSLEVPKKKKGTKKKSTAKKITKNKKAKK